MLKPLERLRERRAENLKFCFYKKVIFKMCKKLKQRRLDMVRKRKRKRKVEWVWQLFDGLIKSVVFLDGRIADGLCRIRTNGTVLARSPNL